MVQGSAELGQRLSINMLRLSAPWHRVQGLTLWKSLPAGSPGWAVSPGGQDEARPRRGAHSPFPPPLATACPHHPSHPRAPFSPPHGFWLFSQKEAGAETCSFYSALLRIQPKIVHCWRPMRRTFKAYDEGGTGLLSVADFRKVSMALAGLLPPNRTWSPNASGQKNVTRPGGRPRHGQAVQTSLPGLPQVTGGHVHLSSAADPRLSPPQRLLESRWAFPGHQHLSAAFHCRCSSEPCLHPTRGRRAA